MNTLLSVVRRVRDRFLSLPSVAIVGLSFCSALALAAPGDLDTGFNLIPNERILSTSVQADGKTVITGMFSSLSGTLRNGAARMNADNATLDSTFNPGVGSSDFVFCSAVQADGKIIFAGRFHYAAGAARNHIVRVNADGTVDAAFNPNVGVNQYDGEFVNCMAFQPDGKIVLVGGFSAVGAVPRNYIARINADGTLASGFNPGADNVVNATAVQPDGKVLVGGDFTTVGGVARSRLARLNADGTVDTSFNPNVNGQVYALTIQPDGKIVVGGTFTTVGGATRSNLARVNANGSIDAGFNPSLGGSPYVTNAVLQTDGKILFCGEFATVNGVTRKGLARLNADGTLDTGFNANVDGGFVYVSNAGLQADGRVIIGGNFSSVGGVQRTNLARLVNDPATQNIVVPASNRVQWLRGGASPEAQAVSFELSVDGGSTWTLLGSGSRMTGGWELTGLSLPAGGHVRTRARTNGGTHNGSHGLVEAVAPFGVQPEIGVEQPALTDVPDGGARSFGEVLLGGATSLNFTIANSGNGPLTGLGMTISGTNAADFTITSNPSAPVPAEGNTSFTVRFAPTASGLKTATLRVASNDADENPFDIVLTGTGTAPEIAVEQPALSNLADGGSRSFGSVLVGSSGSLTFTVRNTGTGSLSGLGLAIDGASASDFTITTAPTAPVLPGGSTTFTVQFSPTTTGAKTAALHLASNDADENPFDISLTGTATAPEIAVEQPALTDIPDGGSKSFGGVLMGSNTSLTFTIRNTGTASLTGLGIILDGAQAADFAVTTNPTAPVVAGGSTTVTVRFAPGGFGARTAALHIASNDADENPFDITLSGSGTGPEIAVEQPALADVPDGGSRSIGGVALGSSTSLTFTIRNLGTGNLTGVGVAIDGPNAADFALTGLPASSVSAPGSTVFTVRFAPSGTGTRLAAIRIASNDADENPFDIQIAGIGTGPGNMNPAFPAAANGHVIGTAIQADGKMVLSGAFTTMNGTPRHRIARLHADGSLDASFDPAANDWVYCTVVQADGKILLGGDFTAISATPRSRLARLNADGTLDGAFTAETDDHVDGLALQADGRILIAGRFTRVNGVTRSRIARLNSDGSLDMGFEPTPDGDVYTVAVQPDGRIVLGGDFNTVDGMARNFLARLHADGALDAGFNPNANGGVYNTAVQPDGKIVIGGSFTSVAGETRNRLARVNRDGSLDTAFHPNANSHVDSTALQADGKILLGGSFTNVGGAARKYLARVHADGSLDASFDPSANGAVFSVAIHSDGTIAVGGDFSTIGATAAGRIARLENEAATQALSLPASGHVQWLRGGASPEIAQVNFAVLPNGGSAWVPIGSGVRNRLLGGWELTGANLPPSGQIRARARTIGGYSNGSSGLIEAAFAYSVGAPDADGDGLLDTWELTWWGTTEGHAATDDTDADGLTDLAELAFGLNPLVSDSASQPRATVEGGYLTLTLTKQTGVSYEVHSAATLVGGGANSFSTATTTVLVDTATTLKVRDNVSYGSSPARFICVKVTAAP